MDRNWKLLAEHAARRRAKLGLSQIEVAQRGPLSLDRVQSIEGAKRKSYRLGTLLALERALGWETGSVETILDGGEPTPLPPVVHVSQVRLEVPAPAAEVEHDEDPKVQRALELLAEATAMLEEIRRERKRGA